MGDLRKIMVKSVSMPSCFMIMLFRAYLHWKISFGYYDILLISRYDHPQSTYTDKLLSSSTCYVARGFMREIWKDDIASTVVFLLRAHLHMAADK